MYAEEVRHKGRLWRSPVQILAWCSCSGVNYRTETAVGSKGGDRIVRS